MIIKLFTFLAIFLWVGRALIKASIADYKSRKIPIKTWNFVVYVILPLSVLLIGSKIWEGSIDINNPLHAIYLTYSLVFMLIIWILAWYSGKYKNIGIGGADFIAIAIIIITSTALDIFLPAVFILFFLIYSAISIIALLHIKKKDFRIPLLIPISIAYFSACGFYVLSGFSAFFVV